MVRKFSGPFRAAHRRCSNHPARVTPAAIQATTLSAAPRAKGQLNHLGRPGWFPDLFLGICGQDDSTGSNGRQAPEACDNAAERRPCQCLAAIAVAPACPRPACRARISSCRA